VLCHFTTRVFGSFSGLSDRISGVVRGCATFSPRGERAPRAGLRDAGTPVREASRHQLQETVVCLINKQRTAGISRLRENQRLNRSAQGWTEEMVRSTTSPRRGLLGPDQRRRL